MGAERKARQLLARVELALAVHQRGTRRPKRREAAQQPAGVGALGRPHRVGVPLRRVAVGFGHEGRLAPHGEAHGLRAELLVHLAARVEDRPPGAGVVGPGDARCLLHPRDRHGEAELHLRLFHRARDRGRRLRLGRRGERDVALAGEQAGGGIEADPARAGQIHLRPGVQVGEVRARPLRPAIHRLHVCDELDEVAGAEPRREAEPPRGLDQQPGAVAARALRLLQRLLRRPHARLHPHDVGDALLDRAVQRPQEIDRPAGPALELRHQRIEQRARRLDAAERGELVLEHVVVGEREGLGIGLEEEVEGVDRRHVGDEVHSDVEARDAIREDHARLEVSLRVLLPVQEVAVRLHLERVGEDRRARVRRRAQADDLRAERHRAPIVVGGLVRQGDVQRHGGGRSGRCGAVIAETRAAQHAVRVGGAARVRGGAKASRNFAGSGLRMYFWELPNGSVFVRPGTPHLPHGEWPRECGVMEGKPREERAQRP